MFSKTALALTLATASSAMAAAPQYIVAISVDGMGYNYPQLLLNQNKLPAIKKMLTEGAGTLNARTDADVAVTLPAHTGMVTGRPRDNHTTPSISGHNWSGNGDPAANQTLATNKGSYIASVFDVVHDNGLSTGLWSGKSKFSLFRDSYNATNGAPDTTGIDNGRNKVDSSYIVSGDPASNLGSNFISSLTASPKNFSFVHFQDADAAGHSSGWGGAAYNAALEAVDTQVGNILSAIQNSPTLNGKTVVMLTADHGGVGTGHGNTAALTDTQIPFLVWGAGVSGGDIYSINPGILTDPGTSIPDYSASGQPIRNGNIANLALDLLGLGPVPGSYVGFAQTIAVPEPASAATLALLAVATLPRRRRH